MENIPLFFSVILLSISSLLSTSVAIHSSAPRGQLVIYNASTQSSPFDDEFNSPTLNPRWHWYNEDPSKWSLTALPGNLRIVGTNNDMWKTCTNPKNLLLQQMPAANFEILTKLFINPTSNYQQGGLLIFKDLDNYIKLDVVWNTTTQNGLSVEFIMEENGIVLNEPNWPWINIGSSNSAFLKIAKSGNSYSGYFSSNGEQWTLVGSWSTSTITDLQVGLFALANNCSGNTLDISADFDFFRVIDRLTLFTGQGFDKCEIPTLSQLQIWITNSPYKVVNLYIGGSRRSCANSALTSSYVTQLSQQGWKFIPTWVGPQCRYGDISSDLTTAYNQGVAEANAAINAATNLGLTLPDSSGTIIYYDMEGYTSQNPNCRDPAKSFITGWTAQLHATGNLSGVYGSSCAANISDFAEISEVPDAVWPAGAGFYSTQYSPNATVWGNSCVADNLWNNHQRIYQYTAGHQETWGGVGLTIDSNVIDGVVADLAISHKLYLPVISKR
jgi:regulation of enolase protein 1 (concanavalin A-like superfamily)